MERKNQRVFIIAIISIVAFLTTFYAASSRNSLAATSAGKKITMGALLSMTSWYAGHEVLDLNEINIAAEMINEKGGITVKGEKYLIEIVIEDGKSTLDGVTAAANRLVFDKGVKFVLGPSAFFAMASGPVTNPNKVLSAISYCTNQPGELDKTTPYSFLGYNSTVGNALACLQYLKKHYPKVKKLSVVFPDDGAIPYLTPIIKKMLSDNGLSMVGEPVGYANETVDYNPIAAKVNTIKDADGVFHVNGIAPGVGGIVKGLRTLGNKKPYVGVITQSMNEVIGIAGKEASKDVFCPIVTYNPGNPPLMKEINRRIVTKHGQGTSILLQTANALWVLKQAIEAAQSLDPTVVKAKWETMDKIETLYGPGRMCGDATYGIKHHVVTHPTAITIVENGEPAWGGMIDPGVLP